MYGLSINFSRTRSEGSPLFKGEMSDPDSYREQRGMLNILFATKSPGHEDSPKNKFNELLKNLFIPKQLS
jgi:hypothetical protein